MTGLWSAQVSERRQHAIHELGRGYGAIEAKDRTGEARQEGFMDLAIAAFARAGLVLRRPIDEPDEILVTRPARRDGGRAELRFLAYGEPCDAHFGRRAHEGDEPETRHEFI